MHSQSIIQSDTEEEKFGIDIVPVVQVRPYKPHLVVHHCLDLESLLLVSIYA